MMLKLPYTFSSPLRPDSSESIQRILQEMWQQIATVVNQQGALAEPFKPSVVNIAKFAAQKFGGVRVNSAIVEDPNFNDSIPAVPLEDFVNVLWQLLGSDVSAYVPRREDIDTFGSTMFGSGNGSNSGGIIFNPYTFNSVATSNEFILPVGGWLRNIFLRTTATQLGATSTLRLKRDGTVIPPQVSITDQQAAGVYNSVRRATRIERGEPFSFEWKIFGGSSGTALRGCAVEFATDDGSSIIGWDNGAAGLAVPASSTRYLTLFTNNNTFPNLDRTETTAALTGTLRNMILRTSSTQHSTGSLVVTLFKNGVSTGITITVAASGAAGIYADLTNTVAVTRGDTLTIEVVNNATSAAAILRTCSFTILPTENTCMIGGNAVGATPARNTTNNLGFFNGGSSTGANLDIPVTRAGRFRNMFIHVDSGGAGSYSVTATLLVNDAATALVINVAADAVAGWKSNITDVVSVNRGDRVRIQLVLGAGGSRIFRGFSVEFLEAA